MTFPSKPSPNLDDHLLLLHRDLLGRIVLVVNDWDDDRLVAGLKAGDERAWRALVERCWERFCEHARRSVGADDQDAVEIAQDALERVLRSIARFEGRARLDTWLYSVVSHACIDFGRVRRNRVINQAGTDDPGCEDYGSDDPRVVGPAGGTPPRSPESAMRHREDRDLLRLHLAQLTRKQQAVIACRQLHELTIEETADVLKMSPGAVKMANLRGMQALVKSIKSARPDHEGGVGR